MEWAGGVVSVASKSAVGPDCDNSQALPIKKVACVGSVTVRTRRGALGRLVVVAHQGFQQREVQGQESWGGENRECGCYWPISVGCAGRQRDRQGGGPSSLLCRAELAGILGTNQVSLGWSRVSAVPAAGLGAGPPVTDADCSSKPSVFSFDARCPLESTTSPPLSFLSPLLSSYSSSSFSSSPPTPCWLPRCFLGVT